MTANLQRLTATALEWLTQERTPLREALMRAIGWVSARSRAIALFRRGDVQASMPLAAQSGDERLIHRSRDILSGDVERLLRCCEPVNTLSSSPDRDSRRILMMLHSDPLQTQNGYGVRTRHVNTALVRAGYQVQVLTRLGYPWDIEHQPESAHANRVEIDGTPIQRVFDSRRGINGPESAYIKAYACQTHQLALEWQAGLLFAHSNYLNGLAAAAVGRTLNLPVAYEARGLWHVTRGLLQPAYNQSEHYHHSERMETLAAAEAGAVIVLSAQMAGWFAERGIPDEKIHVIPNAAAVVEPVSKPEGPFTIGYIGSLVRYEGIQVLLDAISLLRYRNLEVRCLIIGDGTERARLQKQCQRLKLENCVTFVGRVPSKSVREWYECLHCTVVPRLAAPLTELVPPLKPMESLGYGVPVVTSKLSPIVSALGDGAGNLWFRPGCAQSLAEQLATLAGSPILREVLSDQAVRWSQDHSWSTNASSYRELLQTLT